MSLPRFAPCFYRNTTNKTPQLWHFTRRYNSHKNPVSSATQLRTTASLNSAPVLLLLLLRSSQPVRRRPTDRSSLRDFSATATAATKKMASDNEYADFLNKANQDPNEGYNNNSNNINSYGGEQAVELKATDDGADVPAVILQATKDAFYESDADEPFVPVCLAWDEDGKGLPDEEEFARLIHHPDRADTIIEIHQPEDWDREGKYGTVVDAVRRAGKGNDVCVYMVVRGLPRVEYWIVTTDGKGAGARLVGAKVLAIES